MIEFPLTWDRRTLGEVVDILDARRVPLNAAERAARLGSVPYYGASGQVGWIDQPIFDEPLVLLGEDGVQFFDEARQKAYLIDGPAWVNNHAHVLRARGDIDRKFLTYWLNAADYRGLVNGTTRLKLTQAAMKRMVIPVPDLAEQHRIVAILEDHLSRLDAAEHWLSVSGRSTTAMVRSALLQGLRGTFVENDLSEGTAVDALGFRPSFTAREGDQVWGVPEGWLWTRLGDVFEVNVGATPSRSDASLWAGDVPWVSSGEVTFSRIDHTREHITREAAGNPAKRIHPPGTVMLAMIGEGKTRGQAAILNIEAAHNQNCASIRVSATKVLPEYVYGYLEERYLETRRAGAGGVQQALNKAAIQRFPIPIPPLATQRSLVAAWGDVRSSVARLRSEVSRASQRSASLRRTLLAAAFSGRITDGSDLSGAGEMNDA